MLSSIGAFLLLFFAFFATVMFFVNPAGKLEKWMVGRKLNDLRVEVKDKMENRPIELLSSTCGLLFLFFYISFYEFVVDPLAVIIALTGKIGNQAIAYVVLAIIGIAWFNRVRALLRSKKKVDPEEEIKIPGNRVVRFLERLFFSLPELYLWYLFFVVIGVLP